ncbi:MAG: hypothetical protein VB853_14865, partial [Pirellulales bacterium]
LPLKMDNSRLYAAAEAPKLRPTASFLRIQLRGLRFVILIACSMQFSMTAWATPNSVEHRMVNGLLRRRLFALAERYCRDQLAVLDLSDLKRAELTVELSRVFAERALHSGPGTREEHWKKGHEVIAEYLKQAGSRPLSVLTRRQRALIWLARGELARYESEVVAAAGPLLDLARRELRAAISELNDLDDALEKELIAAAQNNSSEAAMLNPDRLRFLQNDVRSQLARALMNQALCYPADTADRINSLNRAVRQYKPLAEVDVPIDWKSRIGLLACLRHLKDNTNWQRLSRLYSAESPLAVEAELKLERAHYYLDLGTANEALDLLGKKPALAAAVAARWDYAKLLALMALWQAEKDSDRAASLHQRTMRQVELLEANHGPYWMRRAEGLLARYVASKPIASDLMLLARAAASYYRAGKLSDALAAYERAWRHAKQSGDKQQEFELAKKSAAVLQQLGRFSDASARFREIATGNPEHADAAQSHLLSAYNAAEALRRSSSPDVKAYAALLAEHIERWPASTTSSTASWWLARAYMSQKLWSDAISVLQKIDPTFESYAASLEALATCYRQQLAKLDRSDKQFAAIADQAAVFFEKVFHHAAENSATAGLSQVAVLHATRFRLYFSQTKTDESAAALRTALATHTGASAAWKASARLLLVYALAAQPDKLSNAHQQFVGLAAATPADLLDLIDRLGTLIVGAPPTARSRLAELSLQAATLLNKSRPKLSPTARYRLDRSIAGALLAAGQRAEAVAKYEQLTKEHPNDERVQVAYAQLLLDGTDAKDWQAALSRWRQNEKKSRRASTMWFRAKYSQAVAHHKLGEPAQAAKIIRVTQTIYPELGGGQLQMQFLELLRRCEPRLRTDQM